MTHLCCVNKMHKIKMFLSLQKMQIRISDYREATDLSGMRPKHLCKRLNCGVYSCNLHFSDT